MDESESVARMVLALVENLAEQVGTSDVEESDVARDHARILASIWRDESFIGLSASAQRMYLLLLSQPRLSLCGVIDYTPARWAALSSDESERQVSAAIDELADEGFVLVDEATQELLVRSFVRHDGILESPNLIQGMWKAWVGVYSQRIRATVVAELPDKAFAAGFGSSKKDYEPPAEALQLRAEPPSGNPSPNPSENPSPTPTTTPSTGTTPSKTLVRSDPEFVPRAVSPPATAVEEVFAAWVASTGKTERTVLDNKRRKLIQNALKRYPLDDVLDAVRGWEQSPYHRGENDHGTVYNDLGLLLRDPSHIERFRDCWRSPPTTKGRPSNVRRGHDAISRVLLGGAG